MQRIVYHYVGESNLNNQAILSDKLILPISVILAHLQADLTYSETTIIIATQVLSYCLSIPTLLILGLLNSTICYLAIQHSHSSTPTTAPITEKQCNNLNILPSFTFWCMITLSLTKTTEFDLAVSTGHSSGPTNNH